MGKGGSAEVLVIGAGIFGLATALACARRGMSVIVADRAEPGAGASGGPVGALSPHPPERWSAKRAFQLETLLAAEGYWASVAALGGLDPEYGRIGRVIPLATPEARALAEARAVEARALWRGARWTVRAAPPWLATGAAPEGVVWETLSARLNPRRAIAALVAALRALGGETRPGWRALSAEESGATFDRGRIAAGTVVIAAGLGGFDLTAPGLGRLGKGVKGQAALLAGGGAPGRPMLYADGLYIVPHADGTVAVGATSEADWTDASATDAALDALMDRARALRPDLGPVLARWAGVRPRGPRPDPMLGPLPGQRRVFVANGGFRTGFGLAPAVGAAMAAMIAGEEPMLPPGFRLTDHLAARRDM
ncbi:FAD-dependent oxidoreductase [uncultured Amaricoccus sp.]|uniref:NAD(P)/FAD-dependent oxidoreductase n=1 Tax=uncultured Amaricoccus sp. TaxID=339341 RepID=UPI002618E273|nr:FAD-dependent oxidoreductase [uncultured Amaricoccus sp.]